MHTNIHTQVFDFLGPDIDLSPTGRADTQREERRRAHLEEQGIKTHRSLRLNKEELVTGGLGKIKEFFDACVFFFSNS